MASHLHEVLVELFRYRPSLVAELLADPFGVKVPEWRQARLESGELPVLAPAEYRADAVVVLTGAGGPTLAVVVEVQLRRDRRKRRSWPVYLAALHSRLGCPAMLLVLCPDAAVARWCAVPITVGHPDWVLSPLVLGPDQVPVVTDARAAGRAPELAVLSAIAHGSGPQAGRVFEALLAALEEVTGEHATLYHDVVLAALPKAARHQLEALMTTGTREYRSDFVRRFVNQGRVEGREEGRVEGETAAVLAVLAARGVDVPDEVRDRITSCADIDQIETWIRRAAIATSVQELFQ